MATLRNHRTQKVYDQEEVQSLSASFGESLRKLRSSRTPKILKENCSQALNLLAAQGVAGTLTTLEKRPIVKISRIGKAPLNKLASGIYKNHFKATMVYDPGALIEYEVLALYAPTDNVVSVPVTTVTAPHILRNKRSPFLSHELRHLWVSTQRRKGYSVCWSTTTEEFEPAYGIRSSFIYADECLCREQDFRISGSKKEHRQLLSNISLVRSRLLRAIHHLNKGDVYATSKELWPGTIGVSFAFRGSKKKLCTFCININQDLGAQARVREVKTLLGNLLDNIVAFSEKYPSLHNTKIAPRPRTIFRKTAQSLKEGLEKTTLKILHECSSVKTHQRVFNSLLRAQNEHPTLCRTISMIDLYHQSPREFGLYKEDVTRELLRLYFTPALPFAEQIYIIRTICSFGKMALAELLCSRSLENTQEDAEIRKLIHDYSLSVP